MNTIWNETIWKGINDEVRKVAGSIRVAQKVFPTILLDNPNSISDDRFNLDDFTIAEGLTKPLVEISLPFQLTPNQVAFEGTLQTGLKLAKLRAAELALIEDQIFFQGINVRLPVSPANLTRESVGRGLLGLATPIAARIHYRRKAGDYDGWSIFVWKGAKNPSPSWAQPYSRTGTDDFGIYFDVEVARGATELFFIIRDAGGNVKNCPEDMVLDLGTQGGEIWQLQDDCRIYPQKPDTSQAGAVNKARAHWPIPVKALETAPPPTWGARTFDAVVKGIKLLNALLQPGPFALILENRVFTDAYSSIGPGAGPIRTAADNITPLVTGGFFGTAALPASTGLLVSLGGEPTTLYVGVEATTALTRKDDDEHHFFRVFERVQFNARDPRAFARLDFLD
jgi:uncharacterized linocin/CFP29 family protein